MNCRISLVCTRPKAVNYRLVDGMWNFLVHLIQYDGRNWIENSSKQDVFINFSVFFQVSPSWRKLAKVKKTVKKMIPRVMMKARQKTAKMMKTRMMTRVKIMILMMKMMKIFQRMKKVYFAFYLSFRFRFLDLIKVQLNVKIPFFGDDCLEILGGSWKFVNRILKQFMMKINCQYISSQWNFPSWCNFTQKQVAQP